MEDVPSIDPQNMARYASIWASSNKAALDYRGDSVASIEAEIAAIEADVKAHKQEAAKCEIEMYRQAGGFEGQHAAVSAGMEPQFDPALLVKKREENAKASGLNGELLEARARLYAAQGHEKAKASLTAIIGALIGGLQ